MNKRVWKEKIREEKDGEVMHGFDPEEAKELKYPTVLSLLSLFTVESLHPFPWGTRDPPLPFCEGVELRAHPGKSLVYTLEVFLNTLFSLSLFFKFPFYL